MPQSGTITRRTFLVGGVAVGTMGLMANVRAVEPDHALSRAMKNNDFGAIEYIQLHISKAFPLKTALHTLESVTQGYTLEKVAACGNMEFEDIPENVLVTFYYKEGFRATISSGPSLNETIGTLRGEGSDIVVKAGHLEIFTSDGQLESSLAFTGSKPDDTPHTLAYVTRALREGVTVFPGKTGI